MNMAEGPQKPSAMFICSHVCNPSAPGYAASRSNSMPHTAMPVPDFAEQPVFVVVMPRHRLAGLEPLRREARPAPLVPELVEVVLAVAAVAVELRERRRIHRGVVRHEDAVVPLATLPVLRELEHLLLRLLLRLRPVGRGQELPLDGKRGVAFHGGPADKDAAPGELPRARPEMVLVRFPPAAAVLPFVVVRQEGEQLLRKPRALDLEEVAESAGRRLGHDAVAAVADVAPQQKRP